MSFARAPLASLLSLVFMLTAPALASPPRDLKERIEDTPDLPQVHESLPGRGGQYCGPVAASNALVWLAGRGYPELVPGSQLELAETLGSPGLMNTAKTRGTGPHALIRGLTGYVEDRGYQVDQVAYHGWRKVKRDLVRTVPGHPNAVEVARRLDADTIGLLNVGWYKKEGGDYRRLGGHWVTLLGADPDDSAILIIHDPARRSPEGQHERMAVTRIESGTLINPNRNTKRDAAGAWQLGGELKINTQKGATTSVLDNVVLLRLK
ncbi:hypothetical protein [Aeoliella sp.]|uniref:hypothetical protein n=1 Tax=Aeoliella sp. TaxID=2795800 RepID=UPI003CCC3727